MLLEKKVIQENYLNRVKDEWVTTIDSFPVFLTEISEEKKVQNEQYIQSISKDFNNQFDCFTYNPIKQKKWKQNILTMLSDVLYHESIINIHNFMNQQQTDGFQEELKDFLRHVRKFAPELTFDGIGQAIRNYIVYAMFNEIHEVKQKFNKACFGYSMLYPYTDNYIDNKNISEEEKKEYNQIIRNKIEGKIVHPKTLHQRKTCELLQAIEDEYPRDIDSNIYTLLLMILEAQENSLQQQNNSKTLTAEERLDISIYKGCTSVIIDRYFVKKEMTEEDLYYYLAFGLYLQLADDLQDIKEDSLHGNQTIFTVDLHCEQEERKVNKIFNFVHHITESYPIKNKKFKTFVLANSYQLIYSSVARSKEFFSKDYLYNLEKYLPVHFTFLENANKNMLENKDLKEQKKYIKILDKLIY